MRNDGEKDFVMLNFHVAAAYTSTGI